MPLTAEFKSLPRAIISKCAKAIKKLKLISKCAKAIKKLKLRRSRDENDDDQSVRSTARTQSIRSQDDLNELREDFNEKLREQKLGIRKKIRFELGKVGKDNQSKKDFLVKIRNEFSELFGDDINNFNNEMYELYKEYNTKYTFSDNISDKLQAFFYKYVDKRIELIQKDIDEQGGKELEEEWNNLKAELPDYGEQKPPEATFFSDNTLIDFKNLHKQLKPSSGNNDDKSGQ